MSLLTGGVPPPTRYRPGDGGRPVGRGRGLATGRVERGHPSEQCPEPPATTHQFRHQDLMHALGNGLLVMGKERPGIPAEHARNAFERLNGDVGFATFDFAEVLQAQVSPLCEFRLRQTMAPPLLLEQGADPLSERRTQRGGHRALPLYGARVLRSAGDSAVWMEVRSTISVSKTSRGV